MEMMEMNEVKTIEIRQEVEIKATKARVFKAIKRFIRLGREVSIEPSEDLRNWMSAHC